MANNLPPIPAPPTQEELIELFTRVTPQEFHQPILGHPSEAVFRALAHQFELLGVKLDRSIQARFFLPSGIQRDVPASCGSRAQGRIVLERVGASEFPLVLSPGVMRLSTRRGERTFLNTTAVTWWPGQEGSQEVVIEAEATGYIGNQDYVQNTDGSLDLEFLQITDQDTARAGVGGTTGVSPAGGYIQDTGVDDLFTPADVGLYVRIDNAANPGIIGQIRRVTGFEWPEQEMPLGTGRYPRRAILDDSIWRRPVEALEFRQTGGTFTDRYTELTQTTGTVDAHSGVVGDALYISCPAVFLSVIADIATQGVGEWQVAWEYWNGTTWEELPDLGDGTQGWTSGSMATVSWTRPADWAVFTSPVTSQTAFTVRARLSGFTSMTTTPQVRRVNTISPEPLPITTNVTWTLLDFRPENLGLRIIAIPEAPAGGADDDLYILGDSRGLYRQGNESCEEFRGRVSRLLDTVSPAAIQRAVNRALRPFGLEGTACDVSSRDANGDLVFPGLFYDVGSGELPFLFAYDMYEPGDAAPVNQYHLYLSETEAYGWFFIKVPNDGTGDFGLFYDDSPIIFQPDDLENGPYLGAAFESLYYDGFPVAYWATLAGLYSTVDRVRAGGIGFTLIRD